MTIFGIWGKRFRKSLTRRRNNAYEGIEGLMSASTGRKIGRWGRKPANARYKGEKRWESNKKRKMAKNAKREAKDKAKREKRKDMIIVAER